MPSGSILQNKFETAHPVSVSASRQKALVFGLILPGLAIRFGNAAYRFLNADEILHYFLGVQPSLVGAYRASLTTAHPPLLIIFLHYWGALGHSELFLRLPLLLAGIGFCWVIYAWMKLAIDESAALIGLALFLFSPALIILSTEVRQYDPLLLFSALSLYLLERAIQRDSWLCMALSALALYLALLSHYSSLIVALAFGIYAVLRFVGARTNLRVILSWAIGQIGALALIAFMFTHHLPMIRARGALEAIEETYLHRSVFWPGEDHLLSFVMRSNIRLFHYLFSQAAVGVLGILLFIAGIVFLFRDGEREHRALRPADWQLGVLFALPLAVNCSLAVFRVYPYGGTRHNSYASMFVFPAIAVAVSRWKPEWKRQKLIALALILLACNLFPSPLGEYIHVRNQSRARMGEAMNLLQSLPPGSLIFTDHEGGLQLSYYLCHEKAVELAQPLSTFLMSPCAQSRMVSVGQWIFKADTFWPDLAGAQQRYKWPSGTPLWFVQAGWFIDNEASLREELKQAGCTAPQQFGRNIFLCEIRVP